MAASPDDAQHADLIPLYPANGRESYHLNIKQRIAGGNTRQNRQLPPSLFIAKRTPAATRAEPMKNHFVTGSPRRSQPRSVPMTG